MCYSAQIWASYRKYVREYLAEIDIGTFAELFWSRLDDDRIKLPKAMEDAFDTSDDSTPPEIKDLIDKFKTQQATKLEQLLFAQRKRLADAERTLLTKTTKAATEAKRISTTKVDWALLKLADLRRTVLKDSDSRIYPGDRKSVV